MCAPAERRRRRDGRGSHAGPRAHPPFAILTAPIGNFWSDFLPREPLRNLILGVRVAGMLPRALVFAFLLTPLVASARCESEVRACQRCAARCAQARGCQPSVCMAVCEAADRCERGRR